jgi:hypothetical protein
MVGARWSVVQAEPPFECPSTCAGEWQELADYCLSAINGTRLRIQPVDATH